MKILPYFALTLALTLALSRGERGFVGMGEGNTYALARTM